MKRFGAGRSLRSVIFVSIAFVSLALFVILHLAEPDPATPLSQRFKLEYFLDSSQGSGVELTIFIVCLMVTVGLLLQWALQPVRRLSDHAARIGPSTLHERLAVDSAPAEIAPLVSAFNTSLDRLETGWNAQRSFSANAAHELRTPVAALRAQVESLLPPDHRQEAIAEFDRLGRIINQLLVLSEGENGPLRHVEVFDLTVLVRDIVSECAPALVRSGRDVALEPLPVQPVRREGDPVLLGAALRNLIENALRHTPPGTSVSVALSGDGLITVEDDGPGLPAGYRERAFEPFSRGARDGAGAGLGLSIVARVAELHGGEAGVDQAPGRTVFRMSIPAL